MNLQKPLPHPRALAHLGDAVYELWVREEAIHHHEKTDSLHQYTIERVKAKTQERLLEALLPALSDELKAFIKRAQNLPVTTSRRSDQSTHRKATAFEALIGYWYLTEPETLSQRKTQIFSLLEELIKQKSPES